MLFDGVHPDRRAALHVWNHRPYSWNPASPSGLFLQSRLSDQTLVEDVDRDTMKVEITAIDTIQLAASPYRTFQK